MDILEGLNPEQRQAVLHDEGPLLVVAGAGTGKTQVITRRIARLINEQKGRPGQILSLTFTEKAAREMEERLYGLIGWQSFQVPVMTFNAFGAELLGRYSLHLGRSVRGGLITDMQKALLLKQHFDRVRLQYFGHQSDQLEFLESIVGYIGKLQNAAVTPSDYADYVSRLSHDTAVHPADVAEQKDLCALYQLYDAVKAETGTYDYYDQVALPVRILSERPNLAQRLSREYRFVLVDEYQDTSPIQDALLRTFVPTGGNIFAVGDDDQAIYSFRGADVDNILSFSDHFAVQKAATLTKNYRSGQPILDAAYALIQHNNPDRLEQRLSINKRLEGVDTDGSVAFASYEKAPDEHAGIADAIAQRLARGTALSDIAILSRSRAPLRALAKVLQARGIDFALAAEVDAFSETEVINLWYLLQWIAGYGDRESISHLLMGPFFGWNSQECRQIVSRAKKELINEEEAIRLFASEGNETCDQTLKKLSVWRGWAEEYPVSQLAYKLIFDTGLAEQLRLKGAQEPRVLRVFEDLYRLLSHMQEFEPYAIDHSVVGYVKEFPRPPKIEAPDLVGVENGVKLLTVHAAKGLEFQVVFILNCTLRSWSERNDVGIQVPEVLTARPSDSAEHELRRLMYVAATRAKRELIVSAPAASSSGQNQQLSVFVRQLVPSAGHAASKREKIDKTQELMQKIQRIYPLKQPGDGVRLPFESADGWLTLGVEALHQYKECPYDFYLQYVLGIKEPFGAQIAFGSAVHGAIHAFYAAVIRGESPQLDELMAQLDNQWRDTGYDSRGESESEKDRAKSALKWFFERETAALAATPAIRTVLGSEVSANFDIPEARLHVRGRIDAYFQTPDGIEIRDFKTGKSPAGEDKAAAKAKEHFQLRTYALSYRTGNGVTPHQVTLDFIASKMLGVAQLSDRILDLHRDKLIGVAQRIRLRDFAPVPSNDFHVCAATKFYGEANGELEDLSTIGATVNEA